MEGFHFARRRAHQFALVALAIFFTADAGSATNDELCVEAPDFEVVTLDDERIALSELKGDKPVYLKFWLTTCPQCLAEMPHFREAHANFGDEVQFVAVNLGVDGDTPDIVRRAMVDLGLDMPGAVDVSGDLQSVFGVIGTPTHVLIDSEGRVRHLGHKADEELDAMLVTLHESGQVED